MAIDTTTEWSRRAVLVGAAGGVAALVAQALGRPAAVNANDPNDVVLGGVNTTTSLTSIENTAADPFADNTAFRAKTSVQGAAVEGVSTSGGLGVVGRSDFGGGVRGESTDGNGVHGFGGHIGVIAEGGAYGVIASATSPLSIGIQASGHRGGEFIGQKAQIRLDPGPWPTHPGTGTAGDIFLDTSKRLWLCKGGTKWVRLDK